MGRLARFNDAAGVVADLDAFCSRCGRHVAPMENPRATSIDSAMPFPNPWAQAGAPSATAQPWPTAGTYAEPSGSGLRWWDGARWTEYGHGAPPPGPAT